MATKKTSRRRISARKTAGRIASPKVYQPGEGRTWYQLGYDHGRDMGTSIQSHIVHKVDREEYKMGYHDGAGDNE